jgi:hypothetical protein
MRDANGSRRPAVAEHENAGQHQHAGHIGDDHAARQNFREIANHGHRRDEEGQEAENGHDDGYADGRTDPRKRAAEHVETGAPRGFLFIPVVKLHHIVHAEAEQNGQ